MIDQVRQWGFRIARRPICNKISRLPWQQLEMAAALLGFLGLWWWLARHAGGPLSWDELLYMNLALNPAPLTFILNRYFHIYAQIPFYELFGGPLPGVRVYWALVAALSVLLVYVCTRLLSGSYLAGGLAVLFFLAQEQFFGNPGVVWPEATLTGMVMLAATIYLLQLRAGPRRKWLLLALGLVMYLAFRSKESGLILAPLLLGLGVWQGQIDLRAFARGLLWVGLGALIAVGLMMALDQIILGNALFSLEVGNIGKTVEFNLGASERSDQSWLLFLADNPEMLLVFVLFLVSLGGLRKTQPWDAALFVWLVPLALIGFLSLVTTVTRFAIVDRYIIPALPLMCVLAALPFRFSQRQGRPAWQPALWLGLALLFAWGYRYAFPAIIQLVSPRGWDENTYFAAVVFPSVLMLLLGLLVLKKDWNPAVALLAFAGIWMILYPSLSKSYDKLASGSFARTSLQLFAPLAETQQWLNCSPEVEIFVSANVYQEQGLLGRDAGSSADMMNVFLVCNFRDGQIEYQDSLEALQTQRFNYAYITAAEWGATSNEERQQILNANQFKMERLSRGIIFLHAGP